MQIKVSKTIKILHKELEIFFLEQTELKRERNLDQGFPEANFFSVKKKNSLSKNFLRKFSKK